MKERPLWPCYRLLRRGEDTLFDWHVPVPFLFTGIEPVYCIDEVPQELDEEDSVTPLSIDASESLCLPGEMHFEYTAIFARGFSIGDLRVWGAANYLTLRALALLRFVKPFFVPAGTYIHIELSKLQRCISDETGVQLSLLGRVCTPEGVVIE